MASTRQKFGQHFLTDEHAIAQIMRAVAARPGDHILEIGPGRGALTKPLLNDLAGETSNVNGTLEVIEIDERLARHLNNTLGKVGDATTTDGERLRIHCADALKFDLSDLLDTGKPLRVVGNLPYDIGSPLLLRLLAEQEARTLADLHVMLQREVAHRLTASPGESEYSGLTVLVGCFAHCHRLLELDADAFDPPPQVRSTFIRLVPRPPLVNKQQWPKLKALVATAFAQRRKKIRHALKPFLGKHIDAARLEALNIDLDQRPQMLSVETFARLARGDGDEQDSQDE